MARFTFDFVLENGGYVLTANSVSLTTACGSESEAKAAIRLLKRQIDDVEKAFAAKSESFKNVSLLKK